MNKSRVVAAVYSASAALGLCDVASATVTGLSVEYNGVHAATGRHIYSVYVLSNGPTAGGMHDVMLNMIGHQVIAGDMMEVVHTDGYVDDSSASPGHWNASYTSASTAATSNKFKDSYVTITGKTGYAASTRLDPSFGSGVNDPANPAIPAAAGWHTADPYVDILITGGKIKVMQIAVTGNQAEHYYRGKMSVGYKLQNTSTPLYAMFLEYGIGSSPSSDLDGDGVPNASDNCPAVSNPDQANNDGDSMGDVCDADDDNDGVPDSSDNCPTSSTPDQANNDGDSMGDVCDADDDNDGVDDLTDAFPLDASESVDTDGDGQGNNADQDDDNDGVPDSSDNCPTASNPDQANNDGDSMADACDADDDNDGVADPSDAFPLDASESVDTDGDGQGDNADQDDDGDGAADSADNCPMVSNPDQADCNGNGTGDTCETPAYDCNGDGVSDECQGGVVVAAASPDLGPPSGDAPIEYSFGAVPLAETAVLIGIDVRGDLDGNTEWIDISINGTAPQRFFEVGGSDCSAAPDHAEITLTREAFNAVLGTGGQLSIAMTCPSAVDPSECKGAGFSRFTVSYLGINPWTGDCDSDGRLDHCAIASGLVPDCNANGTPDSCDIAQGSAFDCDGNGVPDSCDSDDDGDGTIDACDGCPADAAKTAPGQCGCGAPDTDTDGDGTADCNDEDDDNDGVADGQDAFPLDAGESVDSDGDGVGDNADTDDDGDGTPDDADGCPHDPFKTTPGQCGCGVPDSDADWDGIADCIDNCASVHNPGQGDCDGDGVGDACEGEPDCDGNGVPDWCDIAHGGVPDCDGNGYPDSCDIDSGWVPDCNANGVPDSCDLASGASGDCNANGIPDSCDVAQGGLDCDGNGVPDACDIASGAPDTDGDGRPDSCQTVTVPGNYATIQAAIDSASSTELRIVSLPAGTFSGPIIIDGKPILIRGAGAASTIISGTGAPAMSVVQFRDAPSLAGLEGLTVSGGSSGTPWPPETEALTLGGGIFCLNSSMRIIDCVIEDNSGGWGGGMYVLYGGGLIERCTFRDNVANADGGGFQTFWSTTQFVDCTVEFNSCVSRGAGAHIVGGHNTLTRVTFRSNLSVNVVGGLSWSALSGETTPNSLLVDSCAITDNRALVAQGGLGAVGAGSTITIRSTVACSNLPRPNVGGEWTDGGGNSICDCSTDVNDDGQVNAVDLAALLGEFSSCTTCTTDFNGDGVVDGSDVAMLLAQWGHCGG